MNFTMTGVNYLSQSYEKIWNVRDPRVNDWLMMNSPWPTISLCAGYVYICKILGPYLMKDREPFKLKKTIMAYNFIQVLFSSYVFYEAGMAGWFTGYSWLCQDIDRNPDPNSNGKYSLTFVHF